MRPLPIAAMLCLAATSSVAIPTVAAPRRGEVPVATPAGKPVDCLPTYQIRQSRVRSDSVIDFELRNGKTYRNTLPQSCPRLGFEERFGYRTTINQLCSTDIITVLSVAPPVGGASCGLGKFQPVTIAKKAR